ncbi:single-strand DNA-binding protein [Micromonospora pallida]|uniref:Single-strand DNA-binding protein n=1 Tax=Micromonospora pallida TaxID=145854 RepID=A0A1C6TJG3_9ACTN|nr:single-stranded DNA-binding protein [Micromonospora pallida]SCL41703.1 single-strand DNA-binding protein [Micromonospora pallida]
MFDTYVTIVGNVLTAPEWRRTTQSGTLVANFKVASTARRLDRESGRWVDGNSLRVRVNCWRKLAEGVAASVMVGDPVVVAGRLYTRDWIDDAGNHRTLYELEAVTVGHDLARGRGRFLRNRPSMATSAVEDAEAERRVHGELTEPVPDDRVPVSLDDRPVDDDFDLLVPGGPRRPSGFTVDPGDLDPFDAPAGGFEPVGAGVDGPARGSTIRTTTHPSALLDGDEDDDELAALPEEAELPERPVAVGVPAGTEPGGTGPGALGGPLGVESDSPVGELDPLPEDAGFPGGTEEAGEAATPVRRARRGGRGGAGGVRGDGSRSRQPVPA